MATATRHSNPRPQKAHYEFEVRWTIPLSATTHREAAKEALRIQRDPESIATVFEVRRTEAPPGVWEHIDLDEADRKGL